VTVVALAALCLAASLSGCGLFSNEPHPSPTATSSGVDASQEAPTPSPTSRPVRSIALVADVGESQAGTASAVAWLGVQQVAADLHAASSMTIPTSVADLSTEIRTAATTGANIVVTVGASAAAATQTAALANPSVQFFTLDQAVADGAPANLHAIVFDETEMGYLAGVTAASLSQTGRVGLVGDDDSVAATANYAAGFRNGALFADPAAVVAFANAGTPTDPAKGRAAAAGLVAGKADVIAATSDLSGIGAMREACRRKASVVALDTDAWLLVPDVRSCLVTSVRKLYDVAVAAAILRYAEGDEVTSLVLSDVAGGGIGLSDFHVTTPAALTARLNRVLGEMRIGPPRPTAAPSSEPSRATAVPTAS
jgi:basic membrane protein A